MSNLVGDLAFGVRQRPKRTALVAGTCVSTTTVLRAQIETCAGTRVARGIGRRPLDLAGEHIETVVAVFGTARAGGSSSRSIAQKAAQAA